MTLSRYTSVATALFLGLYIHAAVAYLESCDGDEDYSVCGNFRSKYCVCLGGECECADKCNNSYPCDAGYKCVENYAHYEGKDINICLPVACKNNAWICDDPHMVGLSGQKIDWSGVDGGWYALIKDDDVDVQVNLRVTAPLPVEFPDRQLVTGLSVLSAGHSLVIEVKNPYDVTTTGCPEGVSPCLADGGLRAIVDGVQDESLLRSTLRQESVADGNLAVSASNLPVECRQFGGSKIWARMYEEMMQGRRELAVEELFEDWVLRYESMAAPDWCAKYITENDLADVQSISAIFKIETATTTVRLNVGTNSQGDGETDGEGRVLPDMDFWQMDVGMDGLSLDSETLTGLLGETARPVVKNGHKVMEGYEAMRGTIEDYRVDGPLGTNFALLNN